MAISEAIMMPYGKVASELKRNAGRLEMNVTVPNGSILLRRGMERSNLTE